jgi:hypothetical protein
LMIVTNLCDHVAVGSIPGHGDIINGKADAHGFSSRLCGEAITSSCG